MCEEIKMGTYAERTPHSKFAVIAYSSGNTITSSNSDCAESLINKRLERIRDSGKLVNVDKLSRIIWIRNILGDTS
jgi:hypothetical protein